MPAVISTITCRDCCAESARVNVSVFYQPLTPPTGLGLLALPRDGFLPRVARGPVAPRKMACGPLAGKASISGSRLSTRARGAACSLPLSNLWQVETMTRTELIIQLLKIAIGLAFGAYFVWWSLQVLDRLIPILRLSDRLLPSRVARWT